MKIQIWTPEQAQQELRKRLSYAKSARVKKEAQWKQNERTIYGNGMITSSSDLVPTADVSSEDIDSSVSDVNIAFAFKNFRYLHAQMSANPPSVVVRPTSNDQDDKRKADAADRLVRYAIRKYLLQERVDEANLQVLLYGTTFMKTIWDASKGDIIEVDEESGQLTLEGDISIRPVSIWKFFPDPDHEDEMRWGFEEIAIPYEDALLRFPDKAELLMKHRVNYATTNLPGSQSNSALNETHYDAVIIYEYWERGLPVNGQLGRFCELVETGELLSPIKPSPFRFAQVGKVSEIERRDLPAEQKQALLKKIPQIAGFPYHKFTDIDVPGSVYGKSFLEYANPLQDNLNRLDSQQLDIMQAHGVSRMVIPASAEIADDSITNTPWDIVKVTGNQGPWFMTPPQASPMADNLREKFRIGIDEMAGVNEAMFGQQSREQSGFSMQYATNQGNMVRRRLFNKYVLFVESIYKSYLNLIRKHWTVAKTVQVIGKEKAIEAADFQGTDIDGGFDLVVEYGASLSLDPTTRREEILSLQPMFEKAGVPPRIMLQMMKLNEIEGMYDIIQLAEDRQREIFEEIQLTKALIPPREFQDHVNMIAYAMMWFMTTEFKSLPEDIKALCEEHIKLRAQMAANMQTGGLSAQPMPPGPAPMMTGAPPAVAPNTGMMAEAETAAPVPASV